MQTAEELVASYFGAWNERNEQARRALLVQCWSDDGTLCDPIVADVPTGRESVNDAIVKVCAENVPPGHRFARLTAIQEHHHVLRYLWGVVDEEGRVVRRGEDVVSRGPDGRIANVITFFGMPDDLTSPS